MVKLKRLLALLILLSVVILGTVLWRYQLAQEPEKLLDMLPEDIDLALEELHYTQNENGVPRWTLDADRADYRRDSSLVELTEVALHYFSAGPHGTLDLSADHGLLDQQQNSIEIWGDVRLLSERRERLLTERLHYDDELRRLSTAEPFRFDSPRLELRGTGLQLYLDEGRMLVEDQVRALVKQKVPGRDE